MILRKVTALEERILAQVRTWAEQQMNVDGLKRSDCDAAAVARVTRDAFEVSERMAAVLMSLGKQYAKARRKKEK